MPPIDEAGTTQNEGLDIEETVAGIAADLKLSDVGASGADGGETSQTEGAPAGETGGEGAPAKAAPTPADGESAAAPGTASPQAAAPAVDDQAPDTWRKEAKEKWSTLPPELKSEIRKREGDVAKFVEQTRGDVAIAREFTKVFEPYAKLYTERGIDAWQHTANLLHAHATLTWGTPQQKLAAFAGLARDAGIDLRAFAQGDARGAVGNETIQYIQRLESRLNQLQQGVTGVTSTVQAARAQELEQAVLAFAQDKENHPYFWEVADDIRGLIESGQATTLQAAYDIAVLRNPQVRQQVIDSEAAKRAATLASTANARAAKAAKAAGANVRSSGKGRPAAGTGSIDDTLRETLSDINSRS